MPTKQMFNMQVLLTWTILVRVRVRFFCVHAHPLALQTVESQSIVCSNKTVFILYKKRSGATPPLFNVRLSSRWLLLVLRYCLYCLYHWLRDMCEIPHTTYSPHPHSTTTNTGLSSRALHATTKENAAYCSVTHDRSASTTLLPRPKSGSKSATSILLPLKEAGCSKEVSPIA